MKILRPLLTLAALTGSVTAASAGLEAYLSAPQVQTVDAGFTATSTQNFNAAATGAFTTLSSPIGTYTKVAGAPVVRANDMYGGFNQGNYLAVPVGANTSVSLSTPESYFGIFFTAADGTDTISLYDTADALLGTFTAQRLTDFLAKPTITATNGMSYNSTAYKGQPTTDGSAPTKNTGEYYGYVNFVVTSGNQIGRVAFSKGSGGTFESDNHSVKATAPSFANSTFVDLGPVPEPGAVAMVTLGAFAIGGALILRRRRSIA